MESFGTPSSLSGGTGQQLVVRLYVRQEPQGGLSMAKLAALPARPYTSRPHSTWTLGHFRGLLSTRLNCDVRYIRLSTVDGEVLTQGAYSDDTPLGELNIGAGINVTTLREPEVELDLPGSKGRRGQAGGGNGAEKREMQAHARTVLSSDRHHLDVLFTVRRPLVPPPPAASHSLAVTHADPCSAR